MQDTEIATLRAVIDLLIGARSAVSKNIFVVSPFSAGGRPHQNAISR